MALSDSFGAECRRWDAGSAFGVMLPPIVGCLQGYRRHADPFARRTDPEAV
jgi:hypothetical protein